uniref:Pupal cuticle protein Edg-84A n=1 Tax=Stomoxys calcitrans TaxID=35570 RepID=A0A1I8PSZ8_STOCA
MHFKLLATLAFVGVVSAALIPENAEQLDPHPSYEFAYNVDAQESGDIKAQQESRDGENVQGEYSLNDADGYKRIVTYSVNGEGGFRAFVRRERLSDVKQAAAVPKATPKPLTTVTPKPIIPTQAPTKKPIVQQPAYLRTAIVHHHPQPTVYHAARVVHLDHAAHHYVHSAPTTTVLKSAPTVITTTHHHTPAAVVHHHSPAVVHHAPTAALVHHAPASTLVHHAPASAVVHHHTPAISAPHQVSYLHYH